MTDEVQAPFSKPKRPTDCEVRRGPDVNLGILSETLQFRKMSTQTYPGMAGVIVSKHIVVGRQCSLGQTPRADDRGAREGSGR